MSIILAFDTSSEACSCALNINGVVFETFEVVPRLHAKLLLPMIESLLQEHGLSFGELDAIAVGRGPGSFTGLRIGVGVAQGIAFAADLPVIPISTLAALARSAAIKCCRNDNLANTKVFSCIDARIKEVYWGLFEMRGDEPILLDKEYLSKPEQIPLTVLSASETWLGVGSGMAFLKNMNKLIQDKVSPCVELMYPQAGSIVELAKLQYERGEFSKPENVSPVYLRDKVTHG